MCCNVSLIGRAGGGHGLPVERKCEYRSVSHSRSSPEEGRVCQHKGAVPGVDCKERGMISGARGDDRGLNVRVPGAEVVQRRGR